MLCWRIQPSFITGNTVVILFVQCYTALALEPMSRSSSGWDCACAMGFDRDIVRLQGVNRIARPGLTMEGRAQYLIKGLRRGDSNEWAE